MLFLDLVLLLTYLEGHCFNHFAWYFWIPFVIHLGYNRKLDWLFVNKGTHIWLMLFELSFSHGDHWGPWKFCFKFFLLIGTSVKVSRFIFLRTFLAKEIPLTFQYTGPCTHHAHLMGDELSLWVVLIQRDYRSYILDSKSVRASSNGDALLCGHRIVLDG